MASAGAVAATAPLPEGAKVSGLMSWLWLNACVTEESRMSVPFVTDAALGVWTVKCCSYVRWVGAEVMAGREASVPSALYR